MLVIIVWKKRIYVRVFVEVNVFLEMIQLWVRGEVVINYVLENFIFCFVVVEIVVLGWCGLGFVWSLVMVWDGGMWIGVWVVWGVEFLDWIGSVGFVFFFCEIGDWLFKGGKCK